MKCLASKRVASSVLALIEIRLGNKGLSSLSKALASGKLPSNGLDQLELFLLVDRCRLLQFPLQL